jgi:hypothetical protein
MKRLVPLFVLLLMLSSCSKKESDLIWERSFSKGEAISIKTSADSGFAACGFTGTNPYFVRFDKSRSLKIELTSTAGGLFSSFWFDTSGYVMAGNSGGKMLLMRHSKTGKMLWEKTIDAGYRIDLTKLIYSGNGTLLAFGSASPDSSYTGATGIMYVQFDTTGLVISQKNLTDTKFVAAGSAATDNSGNIYLSLTRRNPGTKSKATVAKYNDQFFKLWETELYNNPNFGAACKDLYMTDNGDLLVAGRTEVTSADGPVNNSFVTEISGSGVVLWKKYLESTNTGTSVILNDAGNVLMLNRNCCIVSILEESDGADAGIIRLLGECVSKNTDVLGTSMDVNYDKNLLIAGSRSGNFFVSLKSSQ